MQGSKVVIPNDTEVKSHLLYSMHDSVIAGHGGNATILDINGDVFAQKISVRMKPTRRVARVLPLVCCPLASHKPLVE